tara:strand:- start:72 stop:275 length:204 start_codon:yes stop_codon:yes gene_type:complete
MVLLEKELKDKINYIKVNTVVKHYLDLAAKKVEKSGSDDKLEKFDVAIVDIKKDIKGALKLYKEIMK